MKAPDRSLYWRAAVLDDFVGDRWVSGARASRGRARAAGEDAHPAGREGDRTRRHAPRRGERPAPVRRGRRAARREMYRERQSSPSGLTRGFRYTVWSEAPEPTAAELAQSKPIYPVELIEPGTFLDVGRGITMPPFGQPRLFRLRARALRAARAHGDRGRGQGDDAVRGDGGPRHLVPHDRRLPVHRHAAGEQRRRTARRLRDADARRLLPALRRRDGTDAALPRRTRRASRSGSRAARTTRRAASGA